MSSRAKFEVLLRTLVALALGVTSCVTQGKYDVAVKDAADARGAADAASKRAVEDERTLVVVNERLVQAETDINARLHEISKLKIDSHNLATDLDQQTAIDQQLRSELSHLGKNVDQLLSEKGTLKQSLDDAKKRLDELRKTQAAAEARLALFRDLVAKLKKMTDAGELSVAVRNGRIMLQLPNDVLFDSGQADIKRDGAVVIGKLAEVLKHVGGRQFQVAGHTDNVPIRSSSYRSNWELSTARATAVVRLLIDKGVNPQSLSGAGYAEFDPLVPNDSSEQRAKNRRIEISLVPLVEELASIPTGG